MADEPLREPNALAIELQELVQAESEISTQRRKLHDRLSSFPNELTQRRERELSTERQAIHRRIDEIKKLVDNQE